MTIVVLHFIFCSFYKVMKPQRDTDNYLRFWVLQIIDLYVVYGFITALIQARCLLLLLRPCSVNLQVVNALLYS